MLIAMLITAHTINTIMVRSASASRNSFHQTSSTCSTRMAESFPTVVSEPVSSLLHGVEVDAVSATGHQPVEQPVFSAAGQKPLDVLTRAVPFLTELDQPPVAVHIASELKPESRASVH